MPRTTTLKRSAIGGPTWGTMARPVRTNLPYTGPHGQLLTNTPDAWELNQLLPMGWANDIADNGRPPAWWIGESIDDGWSPIGPHGPFIGNGMVLPVVTRATSLIVDPPTAYPFRVIDPTDLAARYDTPRWMTDPQLLRPDDRYDPPAVPLPMLQRLPRSVFWRDFLACALWWGRAFLWFQTDTDNHPTAGTLRLLHPSFVLPRADGFLVGDETEHVAFDRAGFATIGGVRQRVIMLRNPHGPLGVFASNPEAFTLGERMARYQDSTYGSGVPAGYLKVTNPAPITQEQADDLKARWMAAHGGDRRSIAVLNSSTEFHPIQFDPTTLAIGESKRLLLADIAFAFGMAPETLGLTMGNSATYSNVEQWFDAHRDFALAPWVADLEGVLSALLPGRLTAKVDLARFTPIRYTEAVQVEQAGILTRDEIRAQHGYPPLPDGVGAHIDHRPTIGGTNNE